MLSVTDKMEALMAGIYSECRELPTVREHQSYPRWQYLCLLSRQIKGNICKKSYFNVIKNQAKEYEFRQFLTVHSSLGQQ